MREIFADLHVHIGRSSNGKPIKITASRDLNFENIADECYSKKGIDVVGIIDCASPYVIEDIEDFLSKGFAREIEDGGIIYKDKVCILLGAEVETTEYNEDNKKGSAHNICFFPKLDDIKAFSHDMSGYISNITLSTQKARLSAYELIDIVQKHNGILIPAHIFTPFKSFYGNCTKSLKRIFKEKYDDVFAVELGLSADTEIADQLSELQNKTFITNSDAHSLPKIAREYNKILVEDISFKEIVKALKGEDGRKIIVNYGMNPKLGKYNRTYCEDCNKVAISKPPVYKCEHCGSTNITFGVSDRVELIKDQNSKSPENRPNYIYQVPLEYMPGVGKKTVEKLIEHFDSEMNVLNKTELDDLEAVVGIKLATIIDKSRSAKLEVKAGGGGVYGKLVKE